MSDIEMRELRAKFPLPEGIEDAILNRSQIAAALQVSENTITKWMGAPENPMPVDEQGGNGREYRFCLADCYAWRMDRDETDRAEKERGDTAAAQLAMHFRNLGDEGEAAPTTLTARQIKEESDADYARNKAAELRGSLVRVDRVRDMIEDVLGQFRVTMVTMADFCEMEFGLSPEEVDRLQKRNDEVLVQARLKLTDLTGAIGGEVQDLRAGEQGDMGL